MNYHHFTIEERCPLREYDVKGNVIGKMQNYSAGTSAPSRENCGETARFTELLRGIIRISRKQEQPEERVSAQENVLQRLRRGEGDFILRSGYRTELRMAKENE